MLTHDEVKEMIKPLPKTTKKVICTTTGEIFDSIIEATKKYNTKNIVSCCKNCYGVNHAGQLEDGTPLHWMYYDDYLKKIENGEEIKAKENGSYKKVICLTTNKVFDSMTKGAKEYNIKYPNAIGMNCSGLKQSAGKLPNKVKLVWMYYEDFLKLPQEKQNEILHKNKESSLIEDSFVI